MNTVVLIGNLGEAPRFGDSNGTTFATLSLATSSAFVDKRSGERRTVTDWHRVVAFNGLAKSLRSLAKGDRIAVRGRLKTRTWEQDGIKRWITEVVAAEVQFLRAKRAEADGEVGEEAADEEPEGESVDGAAVPDDDIPF